MIRLSPYSFQCTCVTSPTISNCSAHFHLKLVLDNIKIALNSIAQYVNIEQYVLSKDNYKYCM